MAPIIARTVATFKPVKRYGSDVGMRTRWKMSRSRAAYERISSTDSGRTDVRPRSVFTITAAIAIFEAGERIPNQLFVIGAKAMIGTAFAAIAYGMRAFPSGRHRAST